MTRLLPSRPTTVADGPSDAVDPTGFGVRVDLAACSLLLAGDLDVVAGPFLGVASASLVAGTRGDVTVDLRDVRFVDAGGLGLLVTLANTLRAGGRRLLVRNARARIARIFDLGGLGGLLVDPAPLRRDS